MALTERQVDALCVMLASEVEGVAPAYIASADVIACPMTPEGLLTLVARLRGDDPDALAALAALA